MRWQQRRRRDTYNIAKCSLAAHLKERKKKRMGMLGDRSCKNYCSCSQPKTQHSEERDRDSRSLLIKNLCTLVLAGDTIRRAKFICAPAEYFKCVQRRAALPKNLQISHRIVRRRIVRRSVGWDCPRKRDSAVAAAFYLHNRFAFASSSRDALRQKGGALQANFVTSRLFPCPERAEK